VPQKETLCLGPMCTVMQNLVSIGVTVAKISVTEHTHIYRITADLIADKTHTSVAFVDKNTQKN